MIFLEESWNVRKEREQWKDYKYSFLSGSKKELCCMASWTEQKSEAVWARDAALWP